MLPLCRNWRGKVCLGTVTLYSWSFLPELRWVHLNPILKYNCDSALELLTYEKLIYHKVYVSFVAQSLVCIIPYFMHSLASFYKLSLFSHILFTTRINTHSAVMLYGAFIWHAWGILSYASGKQASIYQNLWRCFGFFRSNWHNVKLK